MTSACFAATVTEPDRPPKQVRNACERTLPRKAASIGAELERTFPSPVGLPTGGRRHSATTAGPLIQEVFMKLLGLSAAALLIASGLSVAHAQNQRTTNVNPPPNSINAGETATTGGQRSGAEAKEVAHNRGVRIIGSARFCTHGRDHVLHCHFRSMASCERHGQHGNFACVANPSATTGAALRP
jgi:hypothetical protein